MDCLQRYLQLGGLGCTAAGGGGKGGGLGCTAAGRARVHCSWGGGLGCTAAGGARVHCSWGLGCTAGGGLGCTQLGARLHCRWGGGARVHCSWGEGARVRLEETQCHAMHRYSTDIVSGLHPRYAHARTPARVPGWSLQHSRRLQKGNQEDVSEREKKRCVCVGRGGGEGGGIHIEGGKGLLGVEGDSTSNIINCVLVPLLTPKHH